jgi:hypothetical protein
MNPEDGKRLADAMERIATVFETQMANNELSEIARENLELTEQQINAQMKRLRDNNWIEPDPDNTPEERRQQHGSWPVNSSRGRRSRRNGLRWKK